MSVILTGFYLLHLHTLLFYAKIVFTAEIIDIFSCFFRLITNYSRTFLRCYEQTIRTFLILKSSFSIEVFASDF